MGFVQQHVHICSKNFGDGLINFLSFIKQISRLGKYERGCRGF